MSTLTLTITNLDQLQHGVIARHRFDCKGGTIGSEGASWRIADRDQSVAPIHCEIRWIEARFCVIDHCGRTYLNDDRRSLGQLPPRCLQEGDRLHVGGYWLQVHYQQNQTIRCSLDELFNPRPRVLDALLADAPASVWTTERSHLQPVSDICQALEPELGRDPLAALDAMPHTAPSKEDVLQRLIAGERP